MNQLSQFCTCRYLDCTLHPTKHDKGCAPCIAKNLKAKEMPGCFFNLLPGAESRTADTFEEFAKQVLRCAGESRDSGE
ncbi:MAG: hypothetical protein HPZ91_06535 [Lentisphaeria bacterium]|nr:hypothetical protein [Lentisphaeria bacterium]